MNYYLGLLLFFALLGGVGLFIYLFISFRKRKKLQEILSMEFPKSYKNYLNNTPYYKKLDDADKQKIEKSILRFIYTKEFVGVGLDVTDEMKVIIAFYACLLLLKKETDNCYDNLLTIIIYPSVVAFERVEANSGIYTKEKFLIDGQAANDTVIIIWHDAKKEAYHLRHDNVIIHEFAHEIDFMDGIADGIPPLERSKYDEWARVLYRDFKNLNEIALKNREWGKYKLLGPYAATNEAEFFAVATERFFESPKSLEKHFPQLYKELKDFYGIDPIKLVG